MFSWHPLIFSGNGSRRRLRRIALDALGHNHTFKASSSLLPVFSIHGIQRSVSGVARISVRIVED